MLATASDDEFPVKTAPTNSARDLRAWWPGVPCWPRGGATSSVADAPLLPVGASRSIQSTVGSRTL